MTAAWDGRALNPEQSGMHLLRSRLTGHLTGWYWNATTGRFHHEHITLGRTALLERYVYEGPILLPPDVAALTQERDRLREALQWMVDNDETNEGDEPLYDKGGRSWNEINAYWIDGLNRARAALKETGHG